ncbi:hypothetical protein ACFY4I_38360 [Streptomyces scabiei]|uniref:hypothetical protein n=1 Tax=Streptomyces scabiei TaxID=1930 RepID=UPI003675F9CB
MPESAEPGSAVERFAVQRLVVRWPAAFSEPLPDEAEVEAETETGADSGGP